MLLFVKMSETASPEPREKGLIDERLAAFYQKHGVGEDGEVSDLKAPYRFIRMHPRYDIGKSVEQLRVRTMWHKECD